MKHKKQVAIVSVVLAVLITVGLVIWQGYKPASENSATIPQVISGRVTHISNECQSDGTCYVTLDDTRSIVTGCGLMAGGKTCKSYDQSKLRLGEHVTATVVKGESGWYSLECDKCTIDVIGGPAY